LPKTGDAWPPSAGLHGSWPILNTSMETDRLDAAVAHADDVVAMSLASARSWVT
jgi:hypothetical protein